jgi:hypothetical protein
MQVLYSTCNVFKLALLPPSGKKICYNDVVLTAGLGHSNEAISFSDIMYLQGLLCILYMLGYDKINNIVILQ